MFLENGYAQGRLKGALHVGSRRKEEGMQPVLQLEGAGAERGNAFWLRDVNLTVEPGTLMGVIGRNGAGKTTLFHMICGLSRISEGEVRVNGVSMKQEPEWCKGEMGLVFDDDYFRLDLSVKHAGVIYGAYYSKYSQGKFLDLCKEFGVDARQNLRKLSRGDYIKFQLAFALAHCPSLILMDEPEAGLDSIFRQEWMDLLYDVMESTCSILFATHLTKELEQRADSVTMLSKGRQIFSNTMLELTEKYKIVRGSKEQMDGLSKHLIGRRRMEHYEEGLFQGEVQGQWEKVSVSKPALADLIEYLDGNFE